MSSRLYRLQRTRKTGVGDLEYSNHARRQMRKRHITEEDVELALRHRVGRPGPGEAGTIWIRGHAVGGRILRMCVRIADQNHVITVAWPDE